MSRALISLDMAQELTAGNRRGTVCVSLVSGWLTTGVRSHEAKNIMKEKMKLGDKVGLLVSEADAESLESD